MSMLISPGRLSRDLKIIGVLSFIFAVMAMGLATKGMSGLLVFIAPLSAGIIYFSLAVGISKREKWAWTFGVITFILLILSSLVFLFLDAMSLFQIAIGLIIPIIFLITLLKGKNELAINNEKSTTPLIFFIIGFALNITSNIYLFYLVSRL